VALCRAAYERRIERLEQENKELARKFADTTKTLQDLVSSKYIETASFSLRW
jgi:hypothetical protein